MLNPAVHAAEGHTWTRNGGNSLLSHHEAVGSWRRRIVPILEGFPRPTPLQARGESFAVRVPLPRVQYQLANKPRERTSTTPSPSLTAFRAASRAATWRETCRAGSSHHARPSTVRRSSFPLSHQLPPEAASAVTPTLTDAGSRRLFSERAQLGLGRSCDPGFPLWGGGIQGPGPGPTCETRQPETDMRVLVYGAQIDHVVLD